MRAFSSRSCHYNVCQEHSCPARVTTLSVRRVSCHHNVCQESVVPLVPLQSVSQVYFSVVFQFSRLRAMFFGFVYPVSGLCSLASCIRYQGSVLWLRVSVFWLLVSGIRALFIGFSSLASVLCSHASVVWPLGSVLRLLGSGLCFPVSGLCALFSELYSHVLGSGYRVSGR